MFSGGNSFKNFAFLLIVFCFVAFGWEHDVSYQGKLTDADGIGITDDLDVHFRIYDALTGGAMLDSATVEMVSIEKGLFSVDIPFDLDALEVTGDMYLEIWVDTDAMTPRQKISAELFAFASHYADSAGAINWSDIHDVPTLGGFQQIRGEGGAWLTDSATIVAGTGMTVTQDGDTIILDASGAGSLQEAYDGGATIEVTGGGDVVDIRALELGTDTDDSDRALEVRNDDDTEPALYVYNSADGPAMYCSGNLRMSGSASVRIYSTADLNLQVDQGDISGSTVQNFNLRDGEDNVFFTVDEDGNATTGNLTLDDITEEIGPNKVVTLDGANNLRWADFPSGSGTGDYIENQFDDMQAADFWINGNGRFGGGTITSDIMVDLNNGTSTSWANPIAGWWGHHRSILIYEASEFPGGGIIDSIAFYIGDVNSLPEDPWQYDDLQIWVLETATAVAPTTWDVSTATSVYGPATYEITGTIGWKSINIDDITWDGTNNLMIYIQNTANSPYYALNAPEWAYTLLPTTDLASQAGSDGGAYPTALVNSYNRPNCRFFMSGVDVTYDQVDVYDGDVSAESFTLDSETIYSWGDFVSRLDTLQATDHDTIVVNNDMKVIGELIADSIQAVGDTVIFDDNIKARCAVFGGGAIPIDEVFFEDFEGGLGAWTIVDSSASTHLWNDLNAGARTPGVSSGVTGNFPIVDSDDAGSGVNVWSSLASPVIDLSGYTEAYLEFGNYYNWLSDDYANVYAYNGTNWILIATYTSDMDEVTTIDISAHVNAAFQVMFVYNDDGAYAWYWAIDNVRIYAPSGAAPPAVEICAGNVTAAGDIEAESFTLDGSTITSWPTGSGGSVTLQDAYDGGPDILIGSGGEVVIDAQESVPDAGDGGRALDVTGNDDSNDGVFRAYNAGDGPAIFSSGHLRINGAKRFYSTTDLKLQLDQGGSSSTTNSFQIEDDAEADVFTVDETGYVEVYDHLELLAGIGGDNARTDWEAMNIVTVGFANADFVMLQDAITYANANAPITILVAPGTYRVPSVTLNAEVVIMGSGKENTIVNAIDVGTFTIASGAAVHNMNFALEVNASGDVYECQVDADFVSDGAMTYDSKLNGMTISSSMSSFEDCMIADFDVTGNATFSDCIIMTGASMVNPESQVHMTGCEVMGSITVNGPMTNTYFEGNYFTTSMITLQAQANGEFKANHFVRCPQAIVVLDEASINALSNDFISPELNGIYVNGASSVRIMGNQFTGYESSVTGIEISDGGVIDECIISSNHISGFQMAGIVVMTLTNPAPTSSVISHNNINNNVVGIQANIMLGMITHNNMAGNITNDLIISSPATTSYNTLDVYINNNPIPIPGCLNQQSNGTIWPNVGLQLGQLQ